MEAQSLPRKFAAYATAWALYLTVCAVAVLVLGGVLELFTHA